MKSAYDIIIRPVLTEKSYDGMADKKYVFEVALNANTHGDQVRRRADLRGREGRNRQHHAPGGQAQAAGPHRGPPSRAQKGHTLRSLKDSKTIEFFEGMAQ